LEDCRDFLETFVDLVYTLEVLPDGAALCLLRLLPPARTIKETPAMKAGLTDRPWGSRELLVLGWQVFNSFPQATHKSVANIGIVPIQFKPVEKHQALG
jgi:hypothetical protein